MLVYNKLLVVLNFLEITNLYSPYVLKVLIMMRYPCYAHYFLSNAIGSMNTLFKLCSNLLEKCALFII